MQCPQDAMNACSPLLIAAAAAYVLDLLPTCVICLFQEAFLLDLLKGVKAEAWKLNRMSWL